MPAPAYPEVQDMILRPLTIATADTIGDYSDSAFANMAMDDDGVIVACGNAARHILVINGTVSTPVQLIGGEFDEDRLYTVAYAEGFGFLLCAAGLSLLTGEIQRFFTCPGNGDYDWVELDQVVFSEDRASYMKVLGVLPGEGFVVFNPGEVASGMCEFHLYDETGYQSTIATLDESSVSSQLYQQTQTVYNNARGKLMVQMSEANELFKLWELDSDGIAEVTDEFNIYAWIATDEEYFYALQQPGAFVAGAGWKVLRIRKATNEIVVLKSLPDVIGFEGDSFLYSTQWFYTLADRHMSYGVTLPAEAHLFITDPDEVQLLQVWIVNAGAITLATSQRYQNPYYYEIGLPEQGMAFLFDSDWVQYVFAGPGEEIYEDINDSVITYSVRGTFRGMLGAAGGGVIYRGISTGFTLGELIVGPIWAGDRRFFVGQVNSTIVEVGQQSSNIGTEGGELTIGALPVIGPDDIYETQDDYPWQAQQQDGVSPPIPDQTLTGYDQIPLFWVNLTAGTRYTISLTPDPDSPEPSDQRSFYSGIFVEGDFLTDVLGLEESQVSLNDVADPVHGVYTSASFTASADGWHLIAVFRDRPDLGFANFYIGVTATEEEGETEMPIQQSNVVQVVINSAPTFPSRRGFHTALIIGTEDVISGSDRIRFYSSIDEVEADFDNTTEEYKAALVAFSQSPRPTRIAIGRWLNTAQAGYMRGGADYEHILSHWTAVEDGEFRCTIDGVAANVGPMDFSSATSLADVADVISTALNAAFAGAPACSFSSVTGFTITSATTGTSSSVTVLSTHSAPSGTDIKEYLAGTTLTGATVQAGLALEPADTALSAIDNKNADWYGFHFCDVEEFTDEQFELAADWAEARTKLHFATIADIDDLARPTYADDNELKRTITTWNSTEPYAGVSAMIRELSVNFSEINSAITMKFKQLPTITADDISTSQKAALDAVHCNYYINYSGNPMYAEGVTGSGRFIDEVHNLDWLQNAIETNVFGYLYTRGTKVLQTDSGMAALAQQVEKACAEAVRNGVLAPGVWNGDNLGEVKTGDLLAAGFYVYWTPIAEQNQSDREARIAPPLQVIATGGGAIHFANVAMNFQR